jgi:hypothetical protein
MNADDQKCAGCGGPLSEADGITLVMDDADLREYYCASCTLSDLQRLREDNQVALAEYQMAKMEQVGADVYFHVTGPSFPPDDPLTP